MAIFTQNMHTDMFRLDASSLPAYDNLLSPEARALQQDTSTPPLDTDLLIAFGARSNSIPAGMIAAYFTKPLKSAHINTWYVIPSSRRQGIGKRLMETLLHELKHEGAIVCTLNYIKEDSSAPAIEKCLTATGWNAGQPLLLRCYFEPAHFDAPWLHLPYRWPKGYEEFFWKDLAPKEKEDLFARENLIPPALSPFRDEMLFEPLNSLGLRRHGRVVGWVITHRIDPDTIRYSSIFIERDLQNRGIAMKLLVDAIILHVKNPTKWALLEMPYQIINPLWGMFIKKKLVPLAAKTIHVLQAWRQI